MNVTNRTTHDVQQGTGAWLRLREGFDTASEAPAALGVSRYVTRAELLRRKHTGIAEEHSPATLGKFAAGHEAEARARPLAEAEAGGDLYPVTMTCEVEGLQLLASLDGLTMDDAIAWETKLWNEELAECVRRGELPAHYTVQMDQELLVSGAFRCLFTCTDGTPERYVSCWYYADEAKFRALVDGWKQFKADLATYTPPPLVDPVVAAPVEALPAVSVRMDGALAVQSNLPAFGVALREFVAKVPKAPSTDQEFADTEAACKALKRAEEALEAAEANALASMADVEAMRRMVADFRTLARDTRLASEKMVERRKQQLKEAEVQKARDALELHVLAANAEIAPARITHAADFGGVIKGLKTLDSIRAKLDAALAAAKIEVDAKARDVRKNLEHFREVARGLESLFADLAQLAHKAPEDFRMLVQARVLAQQERDRKAEEARQAAEAARIAAAEQRAREQEAARIAAAQAAELAAAQAESARLEALAAANRARLAAETAPAAAPARAVVEVSYVTTASAIVAAAPAPAPRADEPATLKLGVICDRLQFKVTAEFVADTLHVKPAKAEGASKLYTETQFRTICRQLQSHVGAMAELYAGEVA